MVVAELVDRENEFAELRAALAEGNRAARARLVLFARRGFAPEVRDRAEQAGVRLVTAADLFTRG